MYFKPRAAFVMQSFRRRLPQLVWIAACLFYLPVFGAGHPGGNGAADLRLKGKVTDDKGEALAGVTVLVEGSKAVTQTDAGGQFEMTVPDHARLVISYAGFISQTIEIKGRTSVNVVLQPNTKLNEVVITGYTTQAKHKLTSAIVSVSGEEMSKRVATDPTSLLQGQLPGVSVVQNSAEPGNEDIQIRLRGLGTFNGSVSPLIIVDGIPGSLSAINPNDIESVTALKDAAAAAIYGSRGANGVIVVKTKKGRAGMLVLTYNYSVGFSTPTRLPKLISNSADYMTLLNEAYKNTGNFDTVYTQAQIDLYRNATDRTKYPNHNWLNDMFSTAIQQNHYLNLSAGTDKTTYSLGFGYTDQPGTLRGFQFQKYTMSLGLSTKVSNRITFGTNLQVTYGRRTYPYNSSTDLYISTLAQTPLYGPQLADGSWVNKAYPKEQNNKNPVLASTIQTNNPDYYGQGNVSLDINLAKGLTWENRFGLTFDVNKSKYFTPQVPEYFWSDGSYARQADVGTSGLNQNEKDDIHSTLYSQLNYKRQFGNHNLSLLGGLQQDVDNYSEMYAFRDGFPTNLLQELNAGSPTNQTNSGTSAVWAIKSYYGSANYDFDDKYLLGASIRYDGTSKLPSNHRWGLYESFSGGWRISQESFLKRVTWLNDLKIRGSWGRLGNVGTLPDYPYQPTLSQGSYAFGGTVSTGFTPTTLVDPSLTWESARMTDVGFDMTILQNKLTISADWFDKLTTNILRGSQVPQWLGLNPPQVNNGSVSNKGIELSLRYQDRVNANFSYYASATFQTYRNKLVNFGSPEYGGPDGQTI
jgi:TonB-linked SusC/RagA family outer membrane protein